MLQAFDNENQLGFVICHEIAHIQLSHVMKKLVKEIGLSVLISMTTGKSGSGTIQEGLKLLSSSAYDRNLEKEADLKAVLADKELLTSILTYHVVAGKVLAADVVGLTSATTVQGSDITISVKDGKVYLNDTIQVIVTDIEASNGVIHVIDGVLLPPQ